MYSLQKELANTLEISPDDILTFKPYPTGYAVITTDMKKYTDVQPTKPEPKPSTQPDHYADHLKGQPAPTLEADLVPADYGLPAGLPEELAEAYFYPSHHKVADLRAVAKALDLPHGSRITKKALITSIEAYKEASATS